MEQKGLRSQGGEMSRFVVNERGEREAVVLSMEEYRKLMAYLEELEDSLELKRAMEEETEFVDYDEFVANMKAEGKL
jgi:PHD/YefM family antitoxin component YafN of YafNO toxin-antitoxin module